VRLAALRAAKVTDPHLIAVGAWCLRWQAVFRVVPKGRAYRRPSE
jgi:hypothetical protein